MSRIVVHKLLNDERWLIVVVLCFALFSRVATGIIVPPWQGPDEPKHFEYVRTLVDMRAQLWNERRLPDVHDEVLTFQREAIASMAKNHYWEFRGQRRPAILPDSFFAIWKGAGTQLHRPSLYYFLGALSLLPFQGVSLEHQLLVVRILSSFLSTLTVAITYLVGREIMPKDRFVPLVGAAFVAALPMHIYMGATVNTDNLLTLVGSVAVLALTIGLCRGFTVRRLGFLFGSLLLAVATKRAAVGLLPVSLLSIPMWLLKFRRRAGLAVIAGLTVLSGAAVLIVSNIWVEGILQLDQLREMVVAYAFNEPDQFDRLLSVPFDSAKAQELITGDLQWLFQSFWGVFGWFVLHLTPELTTIIEWASIACALGFIWWLALQVGAMLRRSRKQSRNEVLVLVVFVLTIVSMVVLTVGERLAYFNASAIPQGRYLFVVVAPIAIVYALGARSYILPRFRQSLAPATICLLALTILDIAVLTNVILPFFVWQTFS